MIKSLRWRLQLWHALLLTTVLIIFGGVVYALQWQTRLQQADAELDRVASVLTSRLRGLFPVPRSQNPGPWRTPNRGPGSSRPPEQTEDRGSPLIADALLPANVPLPVPPPWLLARPRDEDPNDARRRESRGPQRSGSREEGNRQGRNDQAREGQRGNSPDPPRDAANNGPRDPRDSSRWFNPAPGLGLPEEFTHLFEGDEHNFYFIIWDKNGTVLEKSKSVEDIPFPDLHTQADGLPVRQARMREDHREVIHVSRFEMNVLVGRSLVPDFTALHRTGMRLILTGTCVLLIGLAGGWWFSSRAIRPIAEMSAIAESISVKNLSTRINVNSTATELEQLGSVLNRTFDRLQSAFERQGQFTADASHELRTPLAVILSHAELALSRPRAVGDYQNTIQACRRAALRMKTLIDSLLLLARFDSGEPEIELRSVELDRLAVDAVEMLQPLADERHVKLSCRAEALTIDADHDRLFQVLTNLLSNAIRYNKPDGRVDVDVTSDEQSAIIRVVDTGVGIPADELQHVFNRFYRVDKARTTAEGGCGLGLSICQTIVEAHRGTISAFSELNVGTTIEVRLPLVQISPGSDVPSEASNNADMTATLGR
ncbi:MAG TPA: ATP-binding protein [Schlesneria sp.]|jgi:heavy metal sensor kinase